MPGVCLLGNTGSAAEEQDAAAHRTWLLTGRGWSEQESGQLKAHAPGHRHETRAGDLNRRLPAGSEKPGPARLPDLARVDGEKGACRETQRRRRSHEDEPTTRVVVAPGVEQKDRERNRGSG